MTLDLVTDELLQIHLAAQEELSAYPRELVRSVLGHFQRKQFHLFTIDKPVIFNFHGYPSLIHKLAYRRTNHANMHVRGYKEFGSINTPLQLAINNQIDRFNLAIDVIDRVPRLQAVGAHVKDWLKDQICEHLDHAFEYGIDKPEIAEWKWPY